MTNDKEPVTKNQNMISYKSLPGLEGKTNKPGLYQNIYAAPLRAFATIAKPADVTASDAQMVTITVDHTFEIGEGFIKLYSTKDTAQLTSELIGELDGFNMNPKIEFFHPGTDGDALAFANRAPYDEWIFMVKTIEGKYLQIGEEDMGANVRQANAATGTLSSGRKGFTFMADSFNSYFIYEGAITEKPVPVG